MITSSSPDLSIVLDMETMQITGSILFAEQLSLWLSAAEKIAPRVFELIICTRLKVEIKADELPPHVKMIRGRGKGYYALKNEGAALARGRFIFFSDVDCRPSPDYFLHLLAHFEATGADILGGRSFYDGDDFGTRASTVAAFGRLHGINQLPDRAWYLGHNLAIRNGALPGLFGAYTGRYGGDEFIAASARRRNLTLPVFEDLILYHESAAHTLRALLDRHFREIIRTTFVRHGSKMSPWNVVKEAQRSGRQRWLNFKAYSGHFRFSKFEREKARWLFKYYQILDMVAACGFVLRPELLRKWQAYQFGDIATCVPVSGVSSTLEKSSFA